MTTTGKPAEHLPMWAYCAAWALIGPLCTIAANLTVGDPVHFLSTVLVGAPVGALGGIPLYWLEVRFGRIARREAPPM